MLYTLCLSPNAPGGSPIVDASEKARNALDFLGEVGGATTLLPLFPSLSPTLLTTYSGQGSLSTADITDILSKAKTAGITGTPLELLEIILKKTAAPYANTDITISPDSLKTYNVSFSQIFSDPTTRDSHLKFYKKLSEDPGLYWDIVREVKKDERGSGEPEVEIDELFDGLEGSTDEIKLWKKWAGRAFFKFVTEKGKDFEEVVKTNLNGSGAINAELKQAVSDAGIDLGKTYDVYSNVYLDFVDANENPAPIYLDASGKHVPAATAPIAGGRTLTYFIADQVIKQSVDGNDVFVIVENKLSQTSSLTLNQKFAIDTVVGFQVRTQRSSTLDANNSNRDLQAGAEINPAPVKWVKVWDTTDGKAISK